jgi:hypothetical protein
MAAAVKVKPVNVPNKMLGQKKFENTGFAKTAPTRTAKLIITQFIGLINLTKPLSSFVLLNLLLLDSLKCNAYINKFNLDAVCKSFPDYAAVAVAGSIFSEGM